MTKEQRKKLEEMADKHCIPLKTVGFGTLATKSDFMAGAEAAWEMAAKAERERCAKIVIRSTEIPPEALRNGTGVRDRIVIEGERIADLILTPPAEGKSG